MKRKGRLAGFTLAEVLIVLAITALLGAVAYPVYTRQMVKARRIEAQLALVDAMQRQEQHRAQHHTYVAFSSASEKTDAPGFKWWIGRSARASAYELDAYPCPGRAIEECVELRARPGTDRVDDGYADPECGALTYDSTGRQGASGPSVRCWP